MNISYGSILPGFIEQAISNGGTPVIGKGKMASFMDNLLISEAAQKIFVARHGKMHKYGSKVIHIVVYGD